MSNGKIMNFIMWNYERLKDILDVNNNWNKLNLVINNKADDVIQINANQKRQEYEFKRHVKK